MAGTRRLPSAVGNRQRVALPCAAISRAKPKWLSRSPRFGVISTSRIVSLGKERRDRRADLCLGRKNQQPVAVCGKAELARAAKHALRFDAAQFARLDLQIVGQNRARQGERHFVAHFVILRAANDLARLPLPSSTWQTLSRSAFGMLRRCFDLRRRRRCRYSRRALRSLRSRCRPTSARSASSSTLAGRSTNSRSQLTENFILDACILERSGADVEKPHCWSIS